jgi:hypothetical protein
VDLPEELLEADAQLQALQARILGAAHLNPVNVPAARAAFESGAETPPFRYATAIWAPDALEALRRIVVPREHPLGGALAEVIAEVEAQVRALRDRTPQAFEDLADRCGWWPSSRGLEGALPLLPPARPESGDDAPLPPEAMCAQLQRALTDRGHAGWNVLDDPVMSARILVDVPRKTLRVAPHATFRARDVRALVAHEVDVHVQRAVNGARQPLRIFETGLARVHAVEEGLALMAELQVGALDARALERQRWVLRAVVLARSVGFRELHTALREPLGPHVAWAVALRVKRGLARPDLPGVYAKDTVYLEGFLRVHEALEAGFPLELLYAGKVGLDSQVRAWREAGWITPGRVPRLWAGEALRRGRAPSAP